MRAWRLALVGAVAAAACTRPPDPAIVVYAAASTAPVIEPLALLHAEETGVSVRCHFAATTTLARQIEFGARVDVFVSASSTWMDYLELAGHVAAGTRRTLAGNRLVLVVPATRPGDPVTLAGRFPADRFPRFATADPDAAPLGDFARTALATAGWWDDVAPQLIRAADARAALRLVEQGEVDGAIVYASDALGSTRVTTVALIPASFHAPIVYPVALTPDASPAAAAFVMRLASGEGIARFETAGFTPAENGGGDAQ